MVAGARRTHVSPTGPTGCATAAVAARLLQLFVLRVRHTNAARCFAGRWSAPPPAGCGVYEPTPGPPRREFRLYTFLCVCASVEGDGDRLAAAPGSGAYGVGGLSSRVSSCMKRHLLSFSPLSRGGPAPVRPSRVAVS